MDKLIPYGHGSNTEAPASSYKSDSTSDSDRAGGIGLGTTRVAPPEKVPGRTTTRKGEKEKKPGKRANGWKDDGNCTPASCRTWCEVPTGSPWTERIDVYS